MKAGIHSVSLKWLSEALTPAGWPPLEDLHFLLNPVPGKWDRVHIDFAGSGIWVEVVVIEHHITPATLEKDPTQHVTLFVQPRIL